MNNEFSKQWEQLSDTSKKIKPESLSQLFKNNPQRTTELSFETNDIYLDLSKNKWTASNLKDLINLANSADLGEKIKSLFAGKIVNHSEKRAATHYLYRSPDSTEEIALHKGQLCTVAREYLSGNWKTGFEKPVKHIVNIGIGGSFLGPQLAIEALTELQSTNDIKVHFLSSIDNSLWDKIKSEINLDSTLFCLSSKSLGTSETLINWNKVKSLLDNQPEYKPNAKNQSLVIATANTTKALDFNIPSSHILPFQESVGGRFSIWSSIGFPVLMAIGENKFRQFLDGAHLMDEHFQSEQFDRNLPVIMALLSVWNRNFLNISTNVCAPYDYRLRAFPQWLQQLMMESNGKPTGTIVNTKTSPVVFGDHGQLSQHAFFQSLHQGTDVFSVDFIGVNSSEPNQNELLVNMFAQSAALMKGNLDKNNPSFNCPGNRPSSTLILNKLTPSSLGQLMALYEHITYVQSIIWSINCFDQPGVELGKSIAKDVLSALKTNQLDQLELDPSTQHLLKTIFDD